MKPGTRSVELTVRALCKQGGALTLLPIQHACTVALLLRPAQVHPFQHLGPVLRVRTACSSLDEGGRGTASQQQVSLCPTLPRANSNCLVPSYSHHSASDCAHPLLASHTLPQPVLLKVCHTHTCMVSTAPRSSYGPPSSRRSSQAARAASRAAQIDPASAATSTCAASSWRQLRQKAREGLGGVQVTSQEVTSDLQVI